MKAADLIACTGSQNNVRAAYSSGTPALGVGAGNVPVVIDASADLTEAAEKICRSKIFDNATSCSSENAVVILDEVYEAAVAAPEGAGGHMASAEDRPRLAAPLCPDRQPDRALLPSAAARLAAAPGSPPAIPERVP